MSYRTNHDLIDLDCLKIHETAAAVFVEIDGGDRFWVPKSVCELDLDQTGKGTITLPEHFAQEKGMI